MAASNGSSDPQGTSRTIEGVEAKSDISLERRIWTLSPDEVILSVERGFPSFPRGTVDCTSASDTFSHLENPAGPPGFEVPSSHINLDFNPKFAVEQAGSDKLKQWGFPADSATRRQRATRVRALQEQQRMSSSGILLGHPDVLELFHKRSFRLFRQVLPFFRNQDWSLVAMYLTPRQERDYLIVFPNMLIPVIRILLAMFQDHTPVSHFSGVIFGMIFAKPPMQAVKLPVVNTSIEIVFLDLLLEAFYFVDWGLNEYPRDHDGWFHFQSIWQNLCLELRLQIEASTHRAEVPHR